MINDSKKEFGTDIKNHDFIKRSLKLHLTTSSFNKVTGQYETFLRMVYPLLDIAEKGSLENKLNYLENLLSDGEKAILVYSATFLDQKDFAITLFKAGFCKSLPDDYLIAIEHKKLLF